MFILVKRLSVYDFNPFSSSRVFGLPSPQASCSLFHAIERNVNMRFPSARMKVNGVMIAYHNYQFGTGRASAGARMIGNKIEALKNDVIDNCPSRVTMSFIVDVSFGSEINEDDPFGDDVEQADVPSIIDHINRTLPRYRLSGGSFELNRRGTKIIPFSTLNECLAELKGGWFLKDRQDFFSSEADDVNPLDILIDKVYPETVVGEKFVRKPYYIPIHIGYVSISGVPVIREGSRVSDDTGLPTPHVFAEDVTSVGELVYHADIENDYGNLFWKFALDMQKDGMFIVIAE